MTLRPPRRRLEGASGAATLALALALAGCGSSSSSPSGPTDDASTSTDTSTGDTSSGLDGTATADSTSESAIDDAGTDTFVADAPPSHCTKGPALAPGVWTNITPKGLTLPTAPPPYGIAFVTIDPSNSCTLYLTADQAGLWTTNDGGSDWVRLGDPAHVGNTTTQYLDSPIAVAIDPANHDHLYATQGVRGQTLGFWISTDGGSTWSQPAGFITVAATTTNDVTTMAVDPTDFNHVLLGSHSAWKGLTNAGILETKDGGQTFTVIAPIPEFNSGSMGLNFLFNPAKGVGDSKTWLVGTDGNGLYRTTDSGAHFTHITPNSTFPNFSIAHGGHQLYYASNGDAYIGGFVYGAKSSDNGVTWTELTNMPYATYYSIVGDGNLLYTAISFTGDNGGKGPQPFLVSPETDGTTWKPYDPTDSGTPQTFNDGPFVMRFDSGDRILYSANWDTGLWALKVTP